MATRRYLYLSHWDDTYEALVAGTTILHIHKCFTDSGMIRPVQFEELPEGVKDQLIQAISTVDYEI